VTKTIGPFLEVARIQSEINQLFDNLSDLERTAQDGGGWIPNVDVIETSDELLVHAELPGVAADGLSVTVGGGQLHLQGHKEDRDARDGETERGAERRFGRFRRSIQLGVAVNTRLAEATLGDGLLRVRFPKVPNRRGEVVAIEVNPR
jgi:HSP20 family protein